MRAHTLHRVRRPTTMDVPGDEGDASLWDDFGQKVDLTARLREILLNYPEGTSILKELVQNAVRARHVSIPRPSRIVSGVPTSPVL